jgi:hypothetical protein
MTTMSSALQTYQLETMTRLRQMKINGLVILIFKKSYQYSIKFREIPTKGGRQFCDGGILSNIPFRELLQAHRDYWEEVVVKMKMKINSISRALYNKPASF